jgi:putative transposase
MSKSKHTEAQMISALKQLEAGRKAEDVAREYGVSKHTIYAWKAKYGGSEPQARAPGVSGGGSGTAAQEA